MSQDRKIELQIEDNQQHNNEPLKQPQSIASNISNKEALIDHKEEDVLFEETPAYKNNVEKSNFLSYLNFIYEYSTVKKGFQFYKRKQGEKLDEKTLPGLEYSNRAEVIENRLWDYYNERKARKPHSKRNFQFALLKVLKWKLVFLFLLEIAFLFARVFSAYEAYRLLDALYDANAPENEKWIWAAILSGTLGVALYMEHHLIFLKSVIPLHIRNSLISIIYTKASRLSVYSLNQVSLGKIMNIVANDLNVFERAGLFFTNVITGVIGIIAGGALLWFWFGPVCLVGCGYLVFDYIIQEIIMKQSSKPRSQQNGITDERIRITTELLEGIRLLKTYTWELAFGESIKSVRKREVKNLKTIHRLESSARGLAFSSQAMACYLIFMPYVLLGNELSVSIVFPAYLIIGYLRIWAGFYFCLGLGFLSETKLLLERISKIIEIPDMESKTFEEPKNSENAIEFDDFTAYWTKEETTQQTFNLDMNTDNNKDSKNFESFPALRNLNMHIKKGSVNALIGTIGAGKTSFLLSFTGEMPRIEGSLRFKGPIAYVAQEPILFSGTFRENILFGNPYRPDFYNMVIKNCNLENDLKLFKNGDMSLIAEKGTNLSGGQKARLALARAVYADAEIYLLDDPLSAVDAKVALSLYNEAIKTVLKGKTVILATHQVHFIKDLENIMILDGGQIVASGSYKQLKAEYPNINAIFGRDLNNKPSVHSLVELKKKSSIVEEKPQKKAVEIAKENEDLEDDVDEEALEEELKPPEDKPEDPNPNDDPYSKVSVTWKTYKAYSKQIGGFPYLTLIFVLFLITEFGSVGFGRMLGAWATGTFPEWKSLAITGGLAGFILVMYVIKDIIFSSLLMRAAHRFHNIMLDRIIRNPVSFFDTNPIGRILNRFSNDIGVLDRFLPISCLDVVELFFLVGNLIITAAIILPLTLAPFAIAVGVIIILLYYCYPSISQSRQYDLRSRSPMYSLFSASLSGIVIVRLYKQTENFRKKFRRMLNNNCKGGVGFWTCARFFGFFVDIAYNLSAIGNIFIITAKGGVGSGLSGLCLIFILSITGVLQFALRQLIQTHVLFASVARIQAYCETSTEAELAHPTDQNVKSTGWPQKGEIEFSKVYMKYRPEMDHVIKDLSLMAKSGEKIGCVGRTGAGKSSIIQMLFRLVEIDRQDKATSYIKMDQVDIETLGLHLLRNSIAIIPQSPFVFTGTIRRNLDPFGEASDEQIWKALQDVGLKEHVEKFKDKIDTDMTNASMVFSVGQKQLICLARTLLKKAKVLVLDEATANVDKQTDDFIQKTIMEKFSDCTIFTIAHRLSTIANYDKVLVLDKGQKVEFDMPYKLLVKDVEDEDITNPEGHFASMVLNTGPKTSKQILKMAKDTYFKKENGEKKLLTQ